MATQRSAIFRAALGFVIGTLVVFALRMIPALSYLTVGHAIGAGFLVAAGYVALGWLRGNKPAGPA